MSDEDVSLSSLSQEPASSPAPDSAAPTQSQPAEPPAAEPSDKSSKDTLLDAVLKVVPATNEPDVLVKPAEKAPSETPEKEPEDGQAEASPEDVDADESEFTNARTRKKFNQLLKERRELKKVVQEWEQVRPVAEIGLQLQNFARENDLSGEDVAKGMAVMAALRRGDYEFYYRETAAFTRKAQEYLGLALPAEARQQVSQGQMTEAMAREHVRLNMDQQRLVLARQAEQQLYQQRSLEQIQDQVAQSVNAFEERIAASDPDYRAKAPFVKQAVQARLLEKGGHIQTTEEALALTKAAYDDVNAMVRKFQPQRQATSKLPNGNGSTRSARAEPSSLMEAAMLGLERSRNGAAS